MRAGGLAVALAIVALVPSAALAQTIASPRGANGEGVGLEGTWDGSMFLELAYTRRLRTPIFDRPAGMRFSLGAGIPAQTVRTSAGVAIVAARADDVALVLGGALVLAGGPLERGGQTALGLALGAQAGWMAERAYVTVFASVRPTLVSMTIVSGEVDAAAWPATRFVFGVQVGLAIVPALVVFAAAGAHHALGQGDVGPVVTAGIRVHP